MKVMTIKQVKQGAFRREVLFLERDLHRHRVLFYYPLSQGDSSGAQHNESPVLYLHGTGNDATYLTHDLVTYLTEKQVMVIAVDLEGHGRLSEGTWCGDIAQFMADLTQFLRRHNVTSIHLTGHSLGGVIACLSYHHYLSHKNSWPVAILSVTCLAVPTRINFSRIFWELTLFKSPSFFRYIWNHGLYSSLPACGWFKRKQFPIRLVDDKNHNGSGNVSYPLFFSRWITRQQVINVLKGLLNQEGKIFWIESAFDGLSESLPQDLKEDLNRLSSYLRVKTSHLGVLIEPEVIANIYRHIIS
ncbi:MAG: alpha/beta fold hydrolase [Proteobacteria bacterium]|nr:alpha/beta fold hydrolase [Pseudomonadota bacterium]